MNKIKEKLMEKVFLTAALTSVAAVLLICVFLFANGLPAIGEIGIADFMTGTKWKPNDVPPSFGILPMIIGSIYITVGAIIIGVPTGIMTALFLAKVCPAKIYKIAKPATDILAGIPSVVYGFFGMTVIVPTVRSIFDGDGNNILSASILLGIMILPTIISVSESAIRAVPESYYEGSLALGVSHYRSLFFTVLPAAKSGIAAAVILGIGRAIGETMAVNMVAGNQARIPNSILKGVRTLTTNIVMEMGYATELHREALIATGVVLFIFILIINLTFSYMKRRGKSEK
ncbi:MAG: phosphate ABC transporter permease subunit PstC [Clostridia bacterium]|nr:phosphate ABC transporter permease subunit PstC [Clostridia bacterium]